jgi:hypothetical protein
LGDRREVETPPVMYAWKIGAFFSKTRTSLRLLIAVMRSSTASLSRRTTWVKKLDVGKMAVAKRPCLSVNFEKKLMWLGCRPEYTLEPAAWTKMTLSQVEGRARRL